MTMPNHFNTPPSASAANNAGTRHQQHQPSQQAPHHHHQPAPRPYQHRSAHNSPRHSRPGTPLRPSTPVRVHSPLVPLSALHLSPTPVKPALTYGVDTEAFIMSSGLLVQYPQPQMSAPSSPHMRPPSRSERLLRNTLLRDELERKPSDGDSPNSASKTHRRRHSHAPTPTSPPSDGRPYSHSHSHSQTHSPLQSTAILEHYKATHPHSSPRPIPNGHSSHSDSDDDDADRMEAAQYTLGTFLFRSAISNSPTLASPPSRKSPQKKSSSSSSSSARRPRASTTPATPPFTPFATATHVVPGVPVNAYESEPIGNGLFGGSIATAGKGKVESYRVGDSGEFCLHHPNGHHPHHATHTWRSLAQSRSISPSPVPDVNSAGVRRHKSLKTPGEHHRSSRGRSAGSGREGIDRSDSMGLTPHELVLRARLERVLNTGKGIEEREIKLKKELEDRNRRSLERGRRERTSSNEVQDERGIWPWGDKINNNNNHNKDTISTPNTPPDSSYNRSSVHSSSSSHHSSRHAQTNNNTNHPPPLPHQQQRSQPHSPGPQRSKTDPISQHSHSYSVPVTPRHAATFPPLPHHPSIPPLPSSTLHTTPSTTMSLLFSSKMVETPVDERPGPDQILLTPPPTPPTVSRGALPSLLPYSPAAAAAAAAVASFDSRRGGSGSKSSSSCSSSENGVSGPTHRKRLSGSSIPSASASASASTGTSQKNPQQQQQQRGHHHRNSTSTATMTSDVTGSQTVGRRRASTATSTTTRSHPHQRGGSSSASIVPPTTAAAGAIAGGGGVGGAAHGHTRSPSYSPQSKAYRSRERELPPPLDLDSTSNSNSYSSMMMMSTSPTAISPFPTRPTFNTRKASAQCKAIEGYVSFASIEGLGEPPEGLNSPVVGDDDDDERDGRKGLMWRLGVSSLDWRKFLGGSTTENSNPAQQTMIAE